MTQNRKIAIAIAAGLAVLVVLAHDGGDVVGVGSAKEDVDRRLA